MELREKKNTKIYGGSPISSFLLGHSILNANVIEVSSILNVSNSIMLEVRTKLQLLEVKQFTLGFFNLQLLWLNLRQHTKS